jgi:hypothetical protein
VPMACYSLFYPFGTMIAFRIYGGGVAAWS